MIHQHKLLQNFIQLKKLKQLKDIQRHTVGELNPFFSDCHEPPSVVAQVLVNQGMLCLEGSMFGLCLGVQTACTLSEVLPQRTEPGPVCSFKHISDFKSSQLSRHISVSMATQISSSTIPTVGLPVANWLAMVQQQYELVTLHPVMATYSFIVDVPTLTLEDLCKLFGQMGLLLHTEILCDHHMLAEVAYSATLCQLFQLRNATLQLLLETESTGNPQHWKLTIHVFASTAGSLAVCGCDRAGCINVPLGFHPRGPAATETSHAVFPVPSRCYDHSKLSSTALKGCMTCDWDFRGQRNIKYKLIPRKLPA